MRLIDADSLLKNIILYRDNDENDLDFEIGAINHIISIIDNAPTVEEKPTKEQLKNFDVINVIVEEAIKKDGVTIKHKYGTRNDLEESPTAEWIRGRVGKVTEYKCSRCGRTVLDDTGYDVTVDYPYCHCGARMQESEEEE